MPETLPRFRLRRRLAHTTPFAPNGRGHLCAATTATAVFRTHQQGLGALVAWLRWHGVTAATMESTGIYWEVPFRTLEAVGIRADLVHAQHVKQVRGRKTDMADSLWLARICQCGLARPYVPPPALSALR